MTRPINERPRLEQGVGSEGHARRDVKIAGPAGDLNALPAAVGPFVQDSRDANDQGGDQCVDPNVFAGNASIDMQNMAQQRCNQDGSDHDCDEIA
jgi:hypothetical protein